MPKASQPDSRWLSAAIPPDSAKRGLIPNGMAALRLDGNRAAHGFVEMTRWKQEAWNADPMGCGCHPFRVSHSHHPNRWCRYAQPPATGLKMPSASGVPQILRLPTSKQVARLDLSNPAGDPITKHPSGERRTNLFTMKIFPILLAALAMSGLTLTAATDAKNHKGSKECNACCEAASKCDACCHDKGKGEECKACCFDKKEKK